MTKAFVRTLLASILALGATTPALAGNGWKKNPALNGVTMLPQAALEKRYPVGDTLDPATDAAVRALHAVSLIPNAVCGVQIQDGRQFVLIQAQTSNADGSVPYVFAFDPSWDNKYLAQGDNAQAGAKAFYGKPDRPLRSVMESAVQGCVNLRAELGLDPNGTDTGAAPAPAPPPTAPDVPGVPSSAQCAHPPAAATSGETQLAVNEQAGFRVFRDGCKERVAYLALQKRVAKDANAPIRLRSTQQAWAAYVDAHESEYYSHSEDPSYYGSMFSTCASGVQDGMTVERTKELSAEKACAAPDARASEADISAFKAAEAAFLTALRNVQKQRAKEPVFLRVLQRAQASWANYSTAQIAFVGGRDSGEGFACGVREFTRLMQTRAKLLAELARPKQDTCDAD